MRTAAASAPRPLGSATGRRERAGIPEATASAEVLLSELRVIGRAEVALHDEPLTEAQAARYEAWISRRLRHEPVQRILGYAYFRNLRLDLTDRKSVV